MNIEITKDELENVAKEMRDYISPFLVAISVKKAQNCGGACGSASLLEFNEKKYLVTNEHVARVRSRYPLACKSHGDVNIYKLMSPFIALDAPIDVAIADVTELSKNFDSSYTNYIPFAKFTETFNPVEGEFFFTAGFPGSDSNMDIANQILTQNPQFLFGQQVPQFANSIEFALNYNCNAAFALLKPVQFNNPHGLSGSLVWNTKFIECKIKGETWDVSKAIVAGIMKQWDSNNNCLIVTKVEHFNLPTLISHVNQLTYKLPCSSELILGKE